MQDMPRMLLFSSGTQSWKTRSERWTRRSGKGACSPRPRSERLDSLSLYALCATSHNPFAAEASDCG